MPIWPRNPTIFEINTWVWLSSLSEKYGTGLSLDRVPTAELDGIAEFHERSSPTHRQIADLFLGCLFENARIHHGYIGLLLIEQLPDGEDLNLRVLLPPNLIEASLNRLGSHWPSGFRQESLARAARWVNGASYGRKSRSTLPTPLLKRLTAGRHNMGR